MSEIEFNPNQYWEAADEFKQRNNITKCALERSL